MTEKERKMGKKPYKPHHPKQNKPKQTGDFQRQDVPAEEKKEVPVKAVVEKVVKPVIKSVNVQDYSGFNLEEIMLGPQSTKSKKAEAPVKK